MASLGHDYIWDNREFFQQKLKLSKEQLKWLSNREFQRRCRRDGIDRFRAWLMFVVLQYTGKANRWYEEIDTNDTRLELSAHNIHCAYERIG